MFGRPSYIMPTRRRKILLPPPVIKSSAPTVPPPPHVSSIPPKTEKKAEPSPPPSPSCKYCEHDENQHPEREVYAVEHDEKENANIAATDITGANVTSDDADACEKLRQSLKQLNPDLSERDLDEIVQTISARVNFEKLEQRVAELFDDSSPPVMLLKRIVLHQLREGCSAVDNCHIKYLFTDDDFANYALLLQWSALPKKEDITEDEKFRAYNYVLNNLPVKQFTTEEHIEVLRESYNKMMLMLRNNCDDDDNNNSRNSWISNNITFSYLKDKQQSQTSISDNFQEVLPLPKNPGIPIMTRQTDIGAVNTPAFVLRDNSASSSSAFSLVNYDEDFDR